MEGGIIASGVLEWSTACLGEHDTNFAFISTVMGVDGKRLGWSIILHQ
jgi:hypothetical protein